jgi:hypothetical protein
VGQQGVGAQYMSVQYVSMYDLMCIQWLCQYAVSCPHPPPPKLDEDIFTLDFTFFCCCLLSFGGCCCRAVPPPRQAWRWRWLAGCTASSCWLCWSSTATASA